MCSLFHHFGLQNHADDVIVSVLFKSVEMDILSMYKIHA